MASAVQGTLRWAVSLAVVAFCAWMAGHFYRSTGYDALLAEKQRLEQQRRQLQKVVQRLTTERRVAEVEVLQAPLDALDQPLTLLRFVEFDRQDRPLPERYFTIPGNIVFFDALVIKFAEDQIAADDPLRGKSIALFRRIYSENQAPIDGQPVDTASEVPDVYRIADHPTPFERELWREFWSYATDPHKAKAAGVRVAQGEAVYAPLAAGDKWTLTLENDGGLNLIKQPAIDPTHHTPVASSNEEPDV